MLLGQLKIADSYFHGLEHVNNPPPEVQRELGNKAMSFMNPEQLEHLKGMNDKIAPTHSSHFNDDGTPSYHHNDETWSNLGIIGGTAGLAGLAAWAMSRNPQKKTASIFSEKGIGYNTDTKIKGLKTPPKDREEMKANPWLAGGLQAIPLGNLIYGNHKDQANAPYTGLDKMHKIDPGQISWDRGDYYADRSLQSHIGQSSLTNLLKGLAIGAPTGAALGAIGPAMRGEPIDDGLAIGGIVGGLGGAIGGGMYGGYRGAKNYNERVIDKL